MQVAAATASGEGFAAAHDERHAVSPQSHCNAQFSAAAQVESAKQASICELHLSREHEQADGQAEAAQSMSDTETSLLQFVLMQVAAATASGEGFAAAHAERHASSPQAHFSAQFSAAAQVESAKQASICELHLSNEQVQAEGHAESVQSMPKSIAPPLQFVLMQVAAATASGEGFAAAHAERHLSSPQSHCNAQFSAAAQVESARQASICELHLSKEHEQADGQAEDEQSMPSVAAAPTTNVENTNVTNIVTVTRNHGLEIQN